MMKKHMSAKPVENPFRISFCSKVIKQQYIIIRKITKFWIRKRRKRMTKKMKKFTNVKFVKNHGGEKPGCIDTSKLFMKEKDMNAKHVKNPMRPILCSEVI